VRSDHADAPPLSDDAVAGVLAAMSDHLTGIVAAESDAVRRLGTLLARPV
jgi:hypothetical protein